jgi:glycosyltransferase involved in cell wall biosynthesis
MASSEPRSLQTPIIAEGLYSYQFGGSERVGADLALEFKRRGYQVVCFAFRDSHGPLRLELERAGVRCLDMNLEALAGPFRLVRYLWKFWRMLRRERIGALHVHHAGALIFCGIPARVARISSLVMTEHGLHQLRESARYRRVAAYVCRYASEIAVVEPAQVDYFHTKLRVPSAKLHHVENGVRVLDRPADGVERVRKTFAIEDDVFAFFYAGRLSPEKDLGTLLQAFVSLPPDVFSRSRLYLVGDGGQRANLEAARDQLGLGDRVVFLGARSDVPEILSAADAFVMSSKTEGLPMVLLEAMAAKVPCVATAVGGIPNLLADGRGLTVPPQDSAALADAMASVARSAELRERMVARALENLHKTYAFDAFADRYLQLMGLPLRVEGIEAPRSMAKA